MPGAHISHIHATAGVLFILLFTWATFIYKINAPHECFILVFYQNGFISICSLVFVSASPKYTSKLHIKYSHQQSIERRETVQVELWNITFVRHSQPLSLVDGWDWDAVIHTTCDPDDEHTSYISK